MVYIFKRTKKGAFFLVGIVMTGFVSVINTHFRESYLKDTPGFFSTVSADIPVGSCFPAGVLVSTPNGDRAIETIMAGDLVYGFDVVTGKVAEHKVLKTMKHGKGDTDVLFSPIIKITHELGELLVTENHWIYRTNGREGEYANFDRAGTLVVGDLLTMLDGAQSSILSIEKVDDQDFVYNLEVEGVHTYFAGGVRVHNQGDGGGDAGDGGGDAGDGGGDAGDAADSGCCSGGNCK